MRKICRARKTQLRDARRYFHSRNDSDFDVFCILARVTFLVLLLRIDNDSPKADGSDCTSHCHELRYVSRNRYATHDELTTRILYLKSIEIPSVGFLRFFFDPRYAQHLVHPIAEHHEAYIRLISC